MTVSAGLYGGQSPASLRLNVLGGLSLTRDGQPVTGGAAQRRSLAVLAALAGNRQRGISREKLAALLWPESDEENARNSLKQTIYVLRRELCPDVVHGSAELRLGLSVISCDLDEFERAIGRGELEDAVAVYSGTFLDGFHAGGESEEFERWADTERATLVRVYCEALEGLATRAALAKDGAGALHWWRRVSEVDRLDTRYARGVVEAHLAIDDPTGALRHGEAHRAFLRSELGVALPPDFEKLLAGARVSPPVQARGAATWTEPTLAVQPTPLGAQAPAEVLSRRRAHLWSWRIGSVLAAGAVVVAAVAALRRSGSPAMLPPVDSRRIAVVASLGGAADASSMTRSRLLIETIARRLTAAAVATPIVLAGRAGDDPRVAAARAGAAYVISVSTTSGGRAIAEIALTDVATGEQVWGARQELVAADGQVQAVDSVAERSVAAVAVRLDPRMRLWVAASSAPSSVDSYQEFVQGLTLYADRKSAEAELHFQTAARDTAFTMALVMAAWANIYAGKPDVAGSIAKALRERPLPPLDRAMVDHQLAVLSDDLGVEYQAAGAVAAAAAQSEWGYLLAESALKLGRAGEAVRVLDQVGPDLGWMSGTYIRWVLLGRGLHHLGEHEREVKEMMEARRRYPTNRIISQMLLKALAAAGRIPEVDAEIDRALTQRQEDHWDDLQPMDQTIHELRAHGSHDAAQHLAARTLAWMQQQPPADQKRWAGAVPSLLFDSGNAVEARRQLERMVVDDPTERENLVLLAVISARQGDRLRAQRIDAQLERFTNPTLRPYVLAERATIAASLGDRETAVAFLRDAFRAGFEWRSILHAQAGLEPLRDYPPFEELIGPVR